MKRTAEDIEQEFSALPLEDRQDLIPKLLKSARMSNNFCLPEVPETFCKWLFSGEKSLWKDEEVENAWGIWNLLFRRSGGGELFIYGGYHCVSIYDSSELIGFSSNNKDEDSDAETRQRYFANIMEHFFPEDIEIRCEYGKYGYANLTDLAEKYSAEDMTRRGYDRDYVLEEFECE